METHYLCKLIKNIFKGVQTEEPCVSEQCCSQKTRLKGENHSAQQRTHLYKPLVREAQRSLNIQGFVNIPDSWP